MDKLTKYKDLLSTSLVLSALRTTVLARARRMSGLRGGPAFRVLMAFSKKRRKLSRYESTIEGHWFGMHILTV